MKALQGYFPPRFEWACPQCGYKDFVEVLEFFKATAGGKGLRCVNCRVAYEVKIELLDPRSPTLRAAVQSEQKCRSCEGRGWNFVHGTTDKKSCSRCNGSGISNRSAGG